MQKKPWLWGRLSPLGLGIAVLIVAIDQAAQVLDARRLRHPEPGPGASRRSSTSSIVKNTGHQLRPAPAGNPPGAVAAGGLRRPGRARHGRAGWPAASPPGWWPSASGSIMGGAASNAIDRLVLGGVADFFSLHAFGFYWYVFNIADVAIVAGVIGLLYDSFVPSSQ